MQLTDSNGNIYGVGGLEITGIDGKPKVPSSAATLIVNSTPITGGTVGRVLFQGAGDVLQESSNLFWDNVNIRLGIGVTPTRTLHVQHIGTTGVTGSLLFYNQDNSYSGLSVLSNGVGFSLNAHTNGTGYISATSSLNFTSYNGTNPAVLWMGNGSRFRFTNTAETSTYLLIANSGNVLVNTTTDAGYKLDVNGTARVGDTLIQGSGNTSGTTALSAQNSNGTIMFSVRNDRVIRLLSRADFGNVQFYPINDGAYTVASNATQLRMETSFVSGTTTGDFGFSFGTFSAQDSSNANVKSVVHIGSFAPTSGTKTYTTTEIRGTINQTGGANGITRGLYVNPTLTAAADFRAIESSIGRILFNHNNAGNIQADYSVMIKGNNPRLRIEGGTAGTTLADAVIQFADSAGDNWIIKTNRSNGNLVFGLGWNNSITNIVTFGTSTIQPALGVTGVSSSTGTALSVQNSALSSLLTVLNTGNVLIGTTTNAGYKLDVNGTGRIVTSLIIGDTGNPSGSLIVGRTISIGYVATVGANQSFRLGGAGATINTNSFLMSSGGYNNQLGNIGVVRYVVGAAPTSVGANSVTNLYIIGTEAIKLNDGTSSGINSVYNAGIVTVDLSVMEVSLSGNSNVYVGKFAFRFKRYLINGVGIFTDISAVTNLYNSADATLVGTTLTAVANGTDALNLSVTLPATANTANYRMGANVTITKVNNT